MLFLNTMNLTRNYTETRALGHGVRPLSHATTNNNPTFSFFTDAISNNYSATLSYRIYTADGSKSGHTVNVFGYCTATKSGTSSNYLIVADGWYNDAPKYMNYSSIDFANTYGVKYIIQ